MSEVGRTVAGEVWNGKVLEGSELLGVSIAVSGDGTLTSCKQAHIATLSLLYLLTHPLTRQ